MDRMWRTMAGGVAAALGMATACAAAVPGVEDRVDWPSFLGRHDLLWERFPGRWHEGAFTGNGLLGAMVYARTNGTVCLDVGRSDVTDRGNRLAIGFFEMVPAGVPASGTMRLDLWNAEARGDLRTDRGAVAFRTFTHASERVQVVEWTPSGGESSARFEFRHEPALDARKAHKGEPIPDDERNPPPVFGEADGVRHCVQPFKAGGGYAVAWAEKGGGPGRRLLVWSVEAAPDAATAVKRVGEALARGAPALEVSHRAWWHAWWPKSFLSIPDTRMEGFYWIQMYKLASATRADRPAIDLMGPWFRSTPWPRIWWNLNIQLTYWPVYAANRLDLGESLVRMLGAGETNLVANVPEALRGDSAGIGRTSSYDCRGGAGSELGNLTWALHNVWMQARAGGDDAMLRATLVPLLKRSAAYMVHQLKPGDDGRLHFPVDTSPEYPDRAPDTNYNLSLLRWALQALVAADERYALRDPKAAGWRATLEKLAPYPVDPKTGYMIGAGVPLAVSHRHFSHLLMVYPLGLVDVDSAADRPLVERSLDHWIHFEGALQGYSFTGAGAMSAWLGRRDAAVSLMNQFLDRYVKANTMYLEAGPVIETPLAGAATIHELLLQSWCPEPFGTHIRVFPAVPDAWPEASFRDLLAAGGFEVSAARRGGATRWIRIRSLAGNPCRVQTGFPGEAAASGARSFTVSTAPDRNGRRVTTVDLRKGETVLLTPAGAASGGADLVLVPVAPEPDRVNWFGSPKPVVVRPGPDGALHLMATNAVLHGAGLLREFKSKAGNIGHWIDPADAVGWRIAVPRPGGWTMRATHAGGGGVPMRLTVRSAGDPAGPAVAEPEFTPARTSGWDDFKPTDAGRLRFPDAGLYDVTLKPAVPKSPSLNLEGLLLMPETMP
jgi:hypothetical protein